MNLIAIGRAALVCVLLLPVMECNAAKQSVVGEYACHSMGGRPCDTQTSLRLLGNGYWGWGRYSGTYRVSGGTIEFVSGDGGPVTWGPATIGNGTVTFNSGQPVVFEKPSAQVAAIAGSYRCASAEGGCQTRMPIVLDGHGSWSWGGQHGSYAMFGNQIKFQGTTWGPAGWGPADVENGSLRFSSNGKVSVWTAN